MEVRPEKLPDAAIDENVDVHLIRKVEDVLERKQDNPVFICKTCSHDLHEEPCINRV